MEPSIANEGIGTTAAMRRALLAWYRRHGRHDLPWRANRDPWAVLLAELLLQRTRADLVAPIYAETMHRYPTPAAFADAPASDIDALLRPLGLVHRIPRLQQAADAVRDGVPRTTRGLLAVPGVGSYAATATLCFAFGRRVAVVDPSVIRVLSRVLRLASARPRRRTDPLLWQAADSLLPARDAREWNFAVLDLGAGICRPRPLCDECPILRFCPTGRANVGEPYGPPRRPR